MPEVSRLYGIVRPPTALESRDESPVGTAGLPATCSAFLFRYVTEATDGMAATVSLATEPPEDSGSVSVVLDIDCYEHREFTVTGGEMAGIRNALSELRVRKNDIFFRSVTPQALEMWK